MHRQHRSQLSSSSSGSARNSPFLVGIWTMQQNCSPRCLSQAHTTTMSSQYHRHIPQPRPCTITHDPEMGVPAKGKKYTTRVGDEQDSRWWEQWGLTCQKILQLFLNKCRSSRLQLLRSLLPGDLCSLFLWYGNAPIDPCWRTYSLGLREAASGWKNRIQLASLPAASPLWGVWGCVSFPAAPLMVFLVLEGNLFVFKSKINEVSEMAAMLLKVHMGRKCRSLQKEAWAGRYMPAPIMNNSTL